MWVHKAQNIVCAHALSLLGISLATFSANNLVMRDAANFLISPMVSIDIPSCLKFQYFMKANLKLFITNANTTTTLAAFHVGGGYDFHQVWLDVPSGRYQLLWEIHSYVMDPKTVVKTYHAAVNDIAVSGVTCTKLSKLCVL